MSFSMNWIYQDYFPPAPVCLPAHETYGEFSEFVFNLQTSTSAEEFDKKSQKLCNFNIERCVVSEYEGETSVSPISMAIKDGNLKLLAHIIAKAGEKTLRNSLPIGSIFTYWHANVYQLREMPKIIQVVNYLIKHGFDINIPACDLEVQNLHGHLVPGEDIFNVPRRRPKEKMISIKTPLDLIDEIFHTCLIRSKQSLETYRLIELGIKFILPLPCSYTMEEITEFKPQENIFEINRLIKLGARNGFRMTESCARLLKLTSQNIDFYTYHAIRDNSFLLPAKSRVGYIERAIRLCQMRKFTFFKGSQIADSCIAALPKEIIANILTAGECGTDIKRVLRRKIQVCKAQLVEKEVLFILSQRNKNSQISALSQDLVHRILNLRIEASKQK